MVNELDPLLQVGMSNYNYWKDLKQKAKEERARGTNTKTKNTQELRRCTIQTSNSINRRFLPKEKGVDKEKDEINDQDVGLAIEE